MAITFQTGRNQPIRGCSVGNLKQTEHKWSEWKTEWWIWKEGWKGENASYKQIIERRTYSQSETFI